MKEEQEKECRVQSSMKNENTKKINSENRDKSGVKKWENEERTKNQNVKKECSDRKWNKRQVKNCERKLSKQQREKQ